MDEEIDLKEIFNHIWINKLFIFASSVFFFFVIFFYSLSLPDKYNSDAILKITELENNVNSNQSLISSLALLGQNSSSKDASYIIELANSKSFLKNLLINDHIFLHLLCFENYDENTESSIFVEDKEVKVLFDLRKKDIDFLTLKAMGTYRDIINFSYDIDSNMLKIVSSHQSPIFSKEIIEEIIYKLNYYEREKEINQAKESINFLRKAYQENTSSDIKLSISNLITYHLEKEAMASVKNDYLVSYIDPPIKPISKSEPYRFLMAIFGSVFGFILSIILIFLRRFLFEENK